MLGINPQQVSLGTLNPEDDAVSEVLTSQGSFVKLDEATNTTVQTKAKKPGGRTRLRTQNYDHVVAERKRNELFSQSFMALSTMVPGLKKMEKEFNLIIMEAVGKSCVCSSISPERQAGCLVLSFEGNCFKMP
ncbi:uncharacterized protein LOC113763098 isoform X2 [Coffea eugenioides]|nr:uncharacterized protein LOC113763098 isoform X2 [Coffea eugenioides]